MPKAWAILIATLLLALVAAPAIAGDPDLPSGPGKTTIMAQHEGDPDVPIGPRRMEVGDPDLPSGPGRTARSIQADMGDPDLPMGISRWQLIRLMTGAYLALWFR